MQREHKYRAWEKNLKQIIPVHSIDFEKKMINTGSAWRLFDEIELMQYTGLHDNTKWEQLTESEKKSFYNKHKSEDGRTIKYRNVDDVKRLWNGKEIYEGDIVIYQVNTPAEQTAIIKWRNGGFILTDWSDKTTDQYLPDFWYAPIDVEITEVIGNIYENPELLKGE